MAFKTMTLSEVLALPSVDSNEATFDEWSHSPQTTWDVINGGDKDTTDIYHQIIKGKMAAKGINEVPIHVAKGSVMAREYNIHVPFEYWDTVFMGNGHHRVKMMVELGLPIVRVSSNWSKTGESGDLV